MTYPQDYYNKIVCGDILKISKKIPDKSVDLVVTSPPYNLKNSTGNGMKDGRGGKWSNAALQKDTPTIQITCLMMRMWNGSENV